MHAERVELRLEGRDADPGTAAEHDIATTVAGKVKSRAPKIAVQLQQQHQQQMLRNDTILKPVPLAPTGALANHAMSLPPNTLSLPPGVNPLDSNITLWQFLLELLTTGEHQNLIQWTNNEGEFKVGIRTM